MVGNHGCKWHTWWLKQETENNEHFYLKVHQILQIISLSISKTQLLLQFTEIIGTRKFPMCQLYPSKWSLFCVDFVTLFSVRKASKSPSSMSTMALPVEITQIQICSFGWYTPPILLSLGKGHFPRCPKLTTQKWLIWEKYSSSVLLSLRYVWNFSMDHKT